MITIHLVEDNSDLANEIADFLKESGYQVTISNTGQNAIKTNTSHAFDLHILDIGLPDCSGYIVCEKLRKNSLAPILMLTAYDNDEDIIRGLNCGADDYITKPCSLHVLLSRIQALLRRNQWNITKPTSLISGDLLVDIEHATVFRQGSNLYLGKTEFNIVNALIQGHGQILPRAMLLEQVWDSNEQFIEDNTLSVHVSRLRNKLGQFNKKAYIETVKGIGYRWNIEVVRGQSDELE